MPKYKVQLTAQGPMQACIIIDAETAEGAADKAIERWRELEWETSDHPCKTDLDEPCVDEAG